MHVHYIVAKKKMRGSKLKVCKGFGWVEGGEGDDCLPSRDFLVYS